MNNKKLKKVPVYSTKVMMQLVRKGFDVISICDNRENPQFKVFFFDKSPELLKELHINDK